MAVGLRCVRDGLKLVKEIQFVLITGAKQAKKNSYQDTLCYWSHVYTIILIFWILRFRFSLNQSIHTQTVTCFEVEIYAAPSGVE